MIRVLIVDDHPVVRRGIRQILKETPDIIVADEADDGPEALSKIWKHNYDVILLDITLPSQSGLEVLKHIKKEKPKLPVLILSIHPEDLYAVRTLRAGAAGYLTKESVPAELTAAIRVAARGRKYIGPSIAEKLAIELEDGSDKPLHETLSDREFQVMRMLASGKTIKGIAKELSLSAKTISTYRSRVMEKMKMDSNVALTRYTLENKLLR